MNSRPSRHPASGMTLVELVVTIGIFALVAAALSVVLFSSTHLGSRTSRRADVQAGARQALSMMTTEIRQAGADPTIPPAGVVGVSSADSVTVRVRADLNGDGTIQTAEPSEDVTYSWDSSTRTLSRNPGTGSAPVLSNVTAFSLQYFDASGTALTVFPLSATDAAAVHTIRVSLTAEEGDSHPITLTTMVDLRNR